jgi:hypothetical protein
MSKGDIKECSNNKGGNRESIMEVGMRQGQEGESTSMGLVEGRDIGSISNRKSDF